MKYILYVILGIILISGGWYYFNYTKYAPDTYVKETASGPVTVDTNKNTTSTSTPTYKSDEIAKHKDATSCYSIINNSVYDLTMWVNLHPGGKGAILSICGINGTEKFMNKHKGGEKFMNILARYKIGNFIQ